MTVAFEPTGEVFHLPVNESLRIIPTEPDSGLGEDVMDVVVSTTNGVTSVSVWAETHKFKVLYKGEEVFVM